MKSITRLSLALIMFSLFSISYIVTSVSAQGFAGGAPGSAAAGNMNQAEDCMQHPASTPARENCQNRNAAPGSAAAGNTTSSGGISGWIQGGLNALGFGTGSGGNDCMIHPAGSAARTSCENSNSAPGSAAAGGPCADFAPGTPPRQSCERQLNQAAQGNDAAAGDAGGPCADFAPGTPPRQSCERQLNQAAQGNDAAAGDAGGPCADFAPGTPPRQSCERQHGGR
jgi:hypothetical protein